MIRKKRPDVFICRLGREDKGNLKNPELTKHFIRFPLHLDDGCGSRAKQQSAMSKMGMGKQSYKSDFSRLLPNEAAPPLCPFGAGVGRSDSRGKELTTQRPLAIQYFSLKVLDFRVLLLASFHGNKHDSKMAAKRFG